MNEEQQIKQITVVSGKGGTGKSSIIAALAYHFKDKALLADADVDAADLYIIFPPEKSESMEYYGLKKAVVDDDICTKCNLCHDSCRFDAIDESIIVDPFRCEGCGLCYHICPVSAIKMEDRVSGYYHVSKTRIGTMVHANLGPGEESSGLLVAEVRKRAEVEAKKENKSFILIDGSPGIGCPVISSLTGADLALIVTEPTLSGIHDLERLLELLKQFHIPSLVVVNKCDINSDLTEKIEHICADKSRMIAKIPYNDIFTHAMIEQKSVLEMDCTEESETDIQQTILTIALLLEEKLNL